MPTITLDDVESIRGCSPRRCRFADHPIVYKRSGGDYVVGTKFPSIDRLFEMETGILTSGGPYGPYCYLTDQHQIEVALEWQEKRARLIFLRDALYCSIALDLNLSTPGAYTELGAAERKAKLSRDPHAIRLLVQACKTLIMDVPFYRNSEFLCAVPPSPDKPWDLPTVITKQLAGRTGKEDISGSVGFSNAKQSIKSLSLAEKWQALEDGDLQVQRDLRGAKVILVDDKYQSGTTAQFVASKLYNAGAQTVCGLYCVQTWRDTDNT